MEPKTKEEVWVDHLSKEKAAHSNIEFRNDETVYAAMDEFARQDAIGFGVWLHGNWQNILNHGWILQVDTRKYDTIEEIIKHLIPIEKVYELYKSQSK